MDVWDVVILGSMLLIVIGIAVIYWPAALIFSGVMGVSICLLRELSLVSHSRDASSNDSP